MYLADMYDRHYEIFNPTVGEERPLSSVAFHEPERYNDVSYWRSGVRRYFQQKVFEKTGYSPEQFLALPVNFAKILLEELEVVNKQDVAAANTAEEETRRQLQEAGLSVPGGGRGRS